jgi:uncharacterized membrane protein
MSDPRDARVNREQNLPGGSPNDRPSEFQLEAHVGTVLRVGVNTSTACIAIGLLLHLFTPLSGTSAWLMTAGLVMLMATPVARVVASVLEYARAGDTRFFILTSLVLLELCAGIVAALVFHRRL